MATPYCYFQKRIVPLEEAKVGVMTHAFLYGTAVFEGVRGNWSEERGQSLIFRPVEHFRRLKQSAHIMHIDLPQSAEELADICGQVVAATGFREDTYIRPIAYKSGEVIGPRLDGVDRRLHGLRHPVRQLPRPRRRHPLPDVDLAPRARRRDPGAREGERPLRELRARQDGGDRERLRRSDHAQRRRPRRRGLRREPRHGAPRQADHARAQRQRARRHHARIGVPARARRARASTSSSARSPAPSCTSPTSASSPARRRTSRPWSKSIGAPSAAAASARSRRSCRSCSSTRSAAATPSTPAGCTASRRSPSPRRRGSTPDGVPPSARRSVRWSAADSPRGASSSRSRSSSAASRRTSASASSRSTSPRRSSSSSACCSPTGRTASARCATRSTATR